MKLTIVIPALNEEQAIGNIIERTLAARATIIEDAPVDDVEVVVVSDGSTDRTAEIAGSYDQIKLVVFRQNRGYGAAIKRGFEVGGGDLVGFLDADGTCDPGFFAALCTALVEENAAVAIGTRMGPHSRMPRVRRLGNRIYALILSLLSNKIVTDTASGMRVIRRDALQQLYPLPDGLHFTPAMSARVLMDDKLRIVERPMAYEERVGESKLHVARDGLRFLQTIFGMSLMWQPVKVFMASALICLAMMTLLALHPLETWLRAGHLQEDTIYRLLFCWLLGACGFTFLSCGLICQHLHRMWSVARQPRTFLLYVLGRCYSLGGMTVTAALGTPMLLYLVGPGIWSRVTDGYVDLHWSRVVLAGLIAFAILQMGVTTLILNLIRFHTGRAASPSRTQLARRATAAEQDVITARKAASPLQRLTSQQTSTARGNVAHSVGQ